METKTKFWSISLTWSKIMALAVLIAAVGLDWVNTGNNTFMYALPFIVFLITGKQLTDMTKELKKDSQGEIYGCTDPKAKNYNPSATKDNGTCFFEAGQ